MLVFMISNSLRPKLSLAMLYLRISPKTSVSILYFVHFNDHLEKIASANDA